jgi:four helix bundle protein
VRTHKDLDVWEQSIKLAKEVYLLTRQYPKEETYGLVTQMRRAAVSIPSNIAEGAARQGNKEFVHFLYTALGSASELDTQLEVSKEINVGNKEEIGRVQQSLVQVSKMLQGLIRSVKQRPAAE